MYVLFIIHKLKYISPNTTLPFVFWQFKTVWQKKATKRFISDFDCDPWIPISQNIHNLCPSSRRVVNLCKINATNKERCVGKYPHHVTISACPAGLDTFCYLPIYLPHSRCRPKPIFTYFFYFLVPWICVPKYVYTGLFQNSISHFIFNDGIEVMFSQEKQH